MHLLEKKNMNGAFQINFMVNCRMIYWLICIPDCSMSESCLLVIGGIPQSEDAGYQPRNTWKKNMPDSAAPGATTHGQYIFLFDCIRT